MLNIADIIGDLFLVVFPITMAIGYAFKGRVKKLGIGNYLQYVVMALIFTMALWAGNIVASNYVLRIILYSVIYAILSIIMSLVFTMPIGIIINTKRMMEINVNGDFNINTRLPLTLLIILVIGWLLGYYIRFRLIMNIISYLIASELFVLILVIGLDIGSSISMSLLTQGYLGIVIAVTSLLGSSVSGLILHYLVGIPLAASLGVSMGGMGGWYSLAGPCLALGLGLPWAPGLFSQFP
ncbi:lysine exporter LysO family protein [Vulcanisaeta distributa]|uniref:lysine exporter LysO family protein n=1 Tax=Vulcanisaeta distributa TaxID=164451 RepID=UPI000B07486A|nr:lysine exporter LysO family protein [Vulcanisaeta distributa]